MTRDKAGPIVDQSKASKPRRDERDREHSGMIGNAGEKGEAPSPFARHRGETSPADETAPADLDAARDRAG